MVWTTVFVIFGIFLNFSTAYNVETSQTYQVYLRDGGSGAYDASQEPAYAGYTFDVSIQNGETHILVGQPRSGVEGQVISPGSIYNCNISHIPEEEPSGFDEIGSTAPPTHSQATATMLPDSSHTAAHSLNSSTATAFPYSSNTSVESTASVTVTTNIMTTALPTVFTVPTCDRVEVFDQTNLEQRRLNHKNNADALGLNLAKVGSTNQYAVCAPVRERSCATNVSYVPGACYYGMANQTGWNFLEWNETKCFNEIIEIVFVVDGSGSVKVNNYRIVQSWLINVIKELINTYGESVRTEVLQYANKDRRGLYIPIKDSDKFTIPYTLSDGISAEEIEERIRSMAYINGQTFTYYALRRVMEVEFRRSPFYDRSRKMIVVLTDGEANDATFLSDWYNKYKDDVTTFAIGVGNFKEFLKQLREIANGNTGTERVLTVNNFDELQSVLSTLTDGIASTASNEGSRTSTGGNPATDTGNRKLGAAIASDKDGKLYLGAVGMYRDSGVVMTFDGTTEISAEEPTFQQIEQALPERTDDSYLGYSVVIGFFDGANSSEYIAAGAPRYMLQGSVVVYNPVPGDSALHNGVTLKAPGDRGQIGAYFGGCLLSLDVNGDGKDDLFVGSPLYVANNYDEGIVFVYISQDIESPKIWANSSYSPIELSGDHSPHGRFGASMANAGDINLDGYNDIVIGAPLADEGQGAVFIYLGMNSGIVNIPSQKIHASTLNLHQLRYFGQSLQGNVDVDGNQYPDIFVGAPKSDSVVLLRSRPIVAIHSTIEYTETKIDIFECMSQDYKNCSTIEVCFVANGTSLNSPTEINYKLKIDSTKSTGENRLEFLNSATTIAETLSLAENTKYCFKKPVSMKKNIKDYKSNVSATLEFDLTPSHVSIPLSSVRDRTLPNVGSAAIQLFTGCETEVCVPDLQLSGGLIISPFIGRKDGIDIDYSKNGTVFIVDKTTAIQKPTVKLNFTNTGENAFQAKVGVIYSKTVTLLTAVPISGFPTGSCIEEDGSSRPYGDSQMIQEFRYKSDQKVMRANYWCYFEFQVVAASRLRTDGVSPSFTIKEEAYSNSSSSVEKITTNNNLENLAQIKYRSDLEVARGSSEEQLILFNYTHDEMNVSSVSDIGSGTRDIRVAYAIKGLGYSNIPLSEITLKWPWLNGQGDPVLYLYYVECTEKGGNGSTDKCVCDHSKVNPYNLSTNLDEVAGELRTVETTNTRIRSDELSCQSSSTPGCESLKCAVYNLQESVELLFTAVFRLWTPSINFTKPEEDALQLLIDFEISTKQSTLVLNRDFESTEISQQVKITARKFVVDETNWIWIIILASAGGVLILALIVFILYKRGFFNPSEYAIKLEDKKNERDDEINFPDNPYDNEGYEEVTVIDPTIYCNDAEPVGATTNGAKSSPDKLYENMHREKYTDETYPLNDDPDYDLPPDAEDEALPPPPPDMV